MTSADAPRPIWPGAGTGRVRSAPLRAHPLVVDGRIQGAGFGRHLAHVTLRHLLYERIGPMRLGAFVFADGARVWQSGEAEGPRDLVDAGIGLLVDTGLEATDVTLARGAEGWVLSARIQHAP